MNSTFTVFHLCVGPLITSNIQLNDSILVEPIGYYGTNLPDFLSDFVEKLAGEPIQVVTKDLPDVSPENRDPVFSLRININAIDHDQALEKAYEQLEKARYAIAGSYSASIKLFGKVAIQNTSIFYTTDLPKEQGLLWDIPEGGDNLLEKASIAICNSLTDDERLSHLLDLYHQALSAEHRDLKISLLFLTLEAIVSSINNLMGGNKSKNAILLELGYNENTIPLFQIENEDPLTVNHIDFAYEIRNSFFHGGRNHSKQKNKELSKAFSLYQRSPDIFILALAYDCWYALYHWALKSSKAYKSWCNEEISLEKPDKDSDTFKMHFIGCSNLRQGAAGTMIRKGENQGEVFFSFIVRFRSDPVSFRIEVPSGKDPKANSTHPLGYKLELT